MIDFSQETDSQNGSDSRIESVLSVGTGDATTGTNAQPLSLPLGGEFDPVREAGTILPRIENESVAQQLSTLLSTIQQMTAVARQGKAGLADLPLLHARLDEDGSVLLEWVFPDFRIGFNIEPERDNSGWHLVTNKRLGEITMSGQLVNVSETVVSLLEFVFSNV
jgi:hypothetical protein